MAESLRDLFDIYLHKSEEELVQEGSKAATYIMDHFKEGLEGVANDAQDLFLSLFGMFLGADEINQYEVDVFNKITGGYWDIDSFKRVAVRSSNFEFFKKVDEVIDKVGGQLKENVIKLGLVLCAADGEMTIEEENILVMLDD